MSVSMLSGIGQIWRPGSIGLAAAAALLLPSAVTAAEADIPDEGWEHSEAWSYVFDEHTTAANTQAKTVFDWIFEDWSFDGDYEGTFRIETWMDNGLAHRMFETIYSIPETGETVFTDLYLPGGWDAGVNHFGTWEDRSLLWCDPEDEGLLDCVEGELPGGTTYAWAERKHHIEVVVYHTDGSASEVMWTAAWNGEQRELLQVRPTEVLFAAAHLDTAPVWAALEEENRAQE